MSSPSLLSTTEAEREALDFITTNNQDGRYNDLLTRFAAGRISIGILKFNGNGLSALLHEQNRLYNLLQGRPAERLDIDVEAVTRAYDNITTAIEKAEAAIAQPVVYALQKDPA